MRFLHTADIHLKTREHLDTLQVIVETANQNSCDFILIAGDLFDQENSNLTTESGIPAALEKFGGEIYIIPGNHDLKFLSGRKSLSSNSTILNSEAYYLKRKIGDVELLAVPFKENISFKDLGEIPCEAENTILLIHGNFYSSDFFYDEDSKKYLPVFEEDLKDKFRYVALGHYHKLIQKKLGNTMVVNPGSPRITKKSDLGRRMVSLLDTSDWKVELLALDVPYCENIEVFVNVFDRLENIFAKLETAEKNSFSEKAVLTLVLKGFLSSEMEIAHMQNEVRDYLKEKTGRDFSIDTQRISLLDKTLLDSRFVDSFLEELVKSVDETEKEKLKLFALERIAAAI
jgi:DNA repair exonuclease SbcCD nuclease subunit